MNMAKKSLWLVLAAFIAIGCAEERPAIDRVQPYALQKSLFVGEDLADPADNPEFWTQGTLIDVGGYGAAQDGLFVSTYAQSMSRMKWQITEDTLLGRLAYERVEDSDGRGAGPATNDGTVVVAFRIEKHFDIVHAYNPTTGEKLNIIEENDRDRPWYEREYMRVDWSKNLNTDAYDFDTLSLLGVYGGIIYEPLAMDVTDPNDPNAPYFDLENGYFDVTNKAFAKPGLVDLSSFGWGIDSFPACFLPDEFMSGSFPMGSCNPVELTVRHSFRQVVDSDYEPVDWDGYRFQAYGAFYKERFGFARNYGMSDDRWHRFITRYNIWERSHYYDDPETMTGPVECYTPETTPFGGDPHRDANQNGTEDECELVGNGSRCDTFRQRCTLPFADRTPVTTPWYFTSGGDQEFFDASDMASHEWDVALRVGARTAQYAECRRIGGENCEASFPVYFGQQTDNQDAVALAREVDACRRGMAYPDQDCDALADSLGAQRGYDPGVISIAKMPEMIVLCHSPVEANDPQACGEPRLPPGVTAGQCQLAAQEGNDEMLAMCNQAISVRHGDLRYHQVNVIPDPAYPSPWGIYTDAEDPLTGETIAACVNVWSQVTDRASQGMIDQLRYLAGELKTEDVTEGTYVRDWAQAAEAASRTGAAPMMTSEQLAHRVAGFAGAHEHTDHLHVGEVPQLPAGLVEKLHGLKKELTGVAASIHAPTTTRAVYNARLRSAAGTEFEAALMTPMIQQLCGIIGLPLSEGILNVASPLRGGNPTMQRDFFNLKQVALAERGTCILHPHEASAPISITGLAPVLEEKFGAFNPSDNPVVQQERAERMRRYLAHRLHYSVVAHEMGHSVGMRHNFVSSSDAFSYRPQYWQLRTKNGQVAQECTEIDPSGEGCVGPRYFDPVTQEEKDNLIWMWQQSTVMEYPGDITQDMLGLGVFDFAAMRMFYGGTVAVYQDQDFSAGTAKGRAMMDKMDNFGGILGIQHTLAGEDFNYSQLQNNYELIHDCQVVPNAGDFMPAVWDQERDGKWSPLVDGLMVKVDGNYTRCKEKPVDYAFWDQLRMPTGGETSGYYRGGPSVDPEGRPRIPYGFATDGWADLGNLSVYRHDNGADAYEIFNFMITQQEIGHIFDYYRRGRQAFSVRKVASRTLNRYNAKLRDGAKGLGLIKNIYEDFALAEGMDFDSLWPFIAGWLFVDNVVASGQAFDHFTRVLARPEVGPHFRPTGDPVLRSAYDYTGNPRGTEVEIPNGATGYYEDVGLGGKLVENQLSQEHGEYDRDYTINTGSYYDKLSTAMLMTESVDNFISDTRNDFVDPRYRAVSLADLFPEGYRRWLANNLTGDDLLKGPRLVANTSGRPVTELASLYPVTPIGWTSWWGSEPEVCFPNRGTTVCSSYAGITEGAFNPNAPESVAVVDPQVGWEQQKFLIAWTMLYLPENEETKWLDMMRLWELGSDADPGFDNRIELHHPDGRSYVAKTYGKETIFGKIVQKGISARVLEYGNELMFLAYDVTDGPDLDGDGTPDWYLPVFSPTTGEVLVKYDASISHIDENGYVVPGGIPGCNATDNSECTCTSNRACMELQRYLSVPAYLREALSAYQLGEPEQRGTWD
jgi:hypothetical protein